MSEENKYSNTSLCLALFFLPLPSISTLVLKSVQVSLPEHNWRQAERDHGFRGRYAGKTVENYPTHTLNYQKKACNTLTALSCSSTVYSFNKYSSYTACIHTFLEQKMNSLGPSSIPVSTLVLSFILVVFPIGDFISTHRHLRLCHWY